jgi:hypothetical protein
MALILALVKYSLQIISGIIKAMEVATRGRRERVKLGIIKLSSSSSESDSKLYQVSSLSSVASVHSNSSESEESGGKESSN